MFTVDIHDHSDTASWVAGTDSEKEGQWEWFDGFTNARIPFTFTDWGHGEPDAGNCS